MKLSVVILNYNVKYFLELCLKSVQKAILNIDAEIIVVDNNSEDGSCYMVRKQFPEVLLIENRTNFGFSKANNIGVSKSKGEYICILNPDTVVAEDIFFKLFEFSKNIDKLGAIGCKLINGIGDFLPESKRNTPLINASLKKILGNSDNYYANDLKEIDTGKVDILVGAFMFVKRNCYLEVGGFDEDYFMYGEDIDLSYKILKAGYQNYYYGDVTCLHYKGESTLRDKNYAFHFYGAMQIFYKKHFQRNIFFDTLVWFGIRFVYCFRKKTKSKIKKIKKYVFVSNKMNNDLNSVLNKEVVLQSDFKNIEPDNEVIFDANVYDYKKIIFMMENSDNQKNVTYKILPNKSNYIIGSDNAISRGEIISF